MTVRHCIIGELVSVTSTDAKPPISRFQLPFGRAWIMALAKQQRMWLRSFWCLGGGLLRGATFGFAEPGLPPVSASSGMIGRSRVLLSHTLDAARSYWGVGITEWPLIRGRLLLRTSFLAATCFASASGRFLKLGRSTLGGVLKGFLCEGIEGFVSWLSLTGLIQEDPLRNFNPPLAPWSGSKVLGQGYKVTRLMKHESFPQAGPLYIGPFRGVGASFTGLLEGSFTVVLTGAL